MLVHLPFILDEIQLFGLIIKIWKIQMFPILKKKNPKNHMRPFFYFLSKIRKHLSTFLPTISNYVFSNTEDFLFPLQESWVISITKVLPCRCPLQWLHWEATTKSEDLNKKTFFVVVITISNDAFYSLISGLWYIFRSCWTTFEFPDKNHSFW